MIWCSFSLFIALVGALDHFHTDISYANQNTAPSTSTPVYNLQYTCNVTICCTSGALYRGCGEERLKQRWQIQRVAHLCTTVAVEVHHVLMLMKCRNITVTPLCSIVSVETGEKAEKESPVQAEVKPEEPKKSAKKKEKKTRREGGFQIWTELETQRNKFMVTTFAHVCFRIDVLPSHSSCSNSLISWKIFISLL